MPIHDVALVRIERVLEREADIAARLAAALVVTRNIVSAENAVELWRDVQKRLASDRPKVVARG